VEEDQLFWTGFASTRSWLEDEGHLQPLEAVAEPLYLLGGCGVQDHRLCYGGDPRSGCSIDA